MEADPAERAHHLIWSRHSSRTPFDPTWHVTPRELALLVEAARWAPSPHNMQNFQLVVVESPAVLAELGTIRAPMSPLFLAESSCQLAPTPEELERRQTGILATSIPPGGRDQPAPGSAENPRVLGELISGAPMLIVVVFDPTVHAPASEHDVLGMMGLGCMLENMWLIAQALHLDFQVVSSFAAPEIERDVEHVLAITAPWRIAYALRIGHAIAPQITPRIRRDVVRFVHRDHFAK
ncbi:MAG: nitroreductase family protein [Deltaproteobacteria bacterium]